MSDIASDQVAELALKLSIVDQAKLLERVAANLARELTSPMLSDEELYRLDNRPAGSKSIDEIIDEDRGEY
jgi:hypothetical protein